MRRYSLSSTAVAGIMGFASTIAYWGGAAEQDPKPVRPPILKEKLLLEGDSYARSIVFSPDGRLLAIAADSGTITIWDVPAGKEKRKIQAGGKVEAMAWQPNGRRLVGAMYEEKKIRCWDLESGKEVFSVETKAKIPKLAYNPDGKEFAVAGFGTATIEFRDAEKGIVRRTIHPHRSPVTAIAFFPGGKTLASAAIDQTIKISDVSSDVVVITLKGHEMPAQAICISASGKLLASASLDKKVKIWDTKSGELLRTITLSHNAKKVAFCPDEKWLAIGSADTVKGGVISVRETETGRELAAANTGGLTRGLEFNRDGTLLAAAWGNTVRVWQVAERKAPAEKGVPDPKQK